MATVLSAGAASASLRLPGRPLSLRRAVARSTQPALPRLSRGAVSRRRSLAARSAAETEAELSDPPARPETGLKRTAELEEKFAVLDSGKWGCNSCGYVYDEALGDPNYPVPAGMEFQKLPEDWSCPTCGAAPNTFKNMGREVAGFVQNQGYGLGTNSMTSSQKGLLIWGSLAAFFLLFMSGYFLT